ncbi:MAG: FprA family A-type flavoprotein [Bacteroidales bacterium]|nr:FprA family A-type flavoprotein [Bacteroidales bacterium]
MNGNKVIAVTKDVSWIGALDPDLITFDVVMETRYGTTYNSYFIQAEKKCIIETTKERFSDLFLAKVREMTDPAEIGYIVMNHTEPDHSGSLKALLEVAPRAKVVGSGNAIRYLKDLMGFEFSHLIVKDGDTLDLGDKTLRFIGAPNLHWPDSMYTYLEEDKLLFTCDSFGCHYAREEMFDDLVDNFDDAFRYYFNVIMKPYSRFMVQAINKIRSLEIDMICPGHGPILRKNWKKYVDLTEKYAREALVFPYPNRIFIGYVSAYQNTRMIADEIAAGIRMAGEFDVDLCDLEQMDVGDVEQRIIEASGIILGSPTFNQNILMPIYQVFGVINPIRDRNKAAASFGSFGWSGEAAKIIDSAMKMLRLNVVADGLMIRFTPHTETIKHCHEFGSSFGEKMLSEKEEQTLKTG